MGEELKEFVFKFKYVIDVNVPKHDGIVPVSELNSKSKLLKILGRLQMGVRGPSRRLLFKINLVIDVNFPMHDGIEPVSELTPKFKVLNLFDN